MTHSPFYYNHSSQAWPSTGKSVAVQRAAPFAQSASPTLQTTVPLSHTAQNNLYSSRDPSTNDYHPASPDSTASYSRHPSVGERYPIRMPSPTYSQSSRAEQGILSRDVHSRSEIMSSESNKDRGGNMGSSMHMTPEYIYQQHDDEEIEDRMSNHAVWLLIWLAFLLPAFSLFCALYTTIALIIILLISPLQLCHLALPIPSNIQRFLSPLWRAHLRYLKSTRLPHDDDFEPLTSPALLTLILLISPLLSIGVALAAWVAASFWLFALMMGNPDGTERGDDGRNTVVLVRDWWEKCLLKAERMR
ncbi:MAG: hypothetical protein Q9227_001032 [Pyrenula ochraceoflavens]